MRHVADAELKTVGAARRVDDDRSPLPEFGMEAQRAAVEDDTADPRRRGSIGGFTRGQKILRAHADGAGVAGGGCLAVLGHRLQRQLAGSKAKALAVTADEARL